MGVQDQLMQSMTAMQNSISQLAQSICTRPPPGEQGSGKGQTLQGTGKGCENLPGERKAPNLKPTEERAEPTTEEVKCPKCPNTYNWTTRVVCRSCGCKLPQGTVSKISPPPKSTGPASVKTGGGASSSGSLLGNILCLYCKRRNRPGRECQRGKEHPAKEGQNQSRNC